MTSVVLFAILAPQAHKRADLERVKRSLNACDVRLGSRDEHWDLIGSGGLSWGRIATWLVWRQS